MNVPHLLLVVVAIALFLVAAWQYGSPTWNRVVAVGLAALAASMIW